MNGLFFALGVLAAIAILIAALVVTLISYFVISTRFPTQKSKAAWWYITGAAVVSLAVRLAVCVVSIRTEGAGIEGVTGLSFSAGVNALFRSLFFTIGGLTFNGDFSPVGGALLISLYYGVILYAALVFLTLVTAGLSYGIYSKIILALRRTFLAKNTYYIFTAITENSLSLADSIKAKHKQDKKSLGHCTVIFFEKDGKPFSRENAFHRQLMRKGYLFKSSTHKNYLGNTVCILKELKLVKRNLQKYDTGDRQNKVLHIFAIDDNGDFEHANAEIVFNDFEAIFKKYAKIEDGGIKVKLPTVVNYYLLTGGDVNYEGYEKKKDEILFGFLSANDKLHSVEHKEGLEKSLKINVFSEAALSAYGMINARNNRLDKLGRNAFKEDTRPDKHGAYRVSVIGFNKTAEYAMQELYTHTAFIDEKTHGGTQFIADIYEGGTEGKEGLFACNHPLFRCLNDDVKTDTESIVEAADALPSKACDVLKEGYKYSLNDKKIDSNTALPADKFIKTMCLPIAVFHKESCFNYPMMGEDGADGAVNAAKHNNTRAFIVSLGSDESNIEMANALIDSFKRSFLKDEMTGITDTAERHITLFVHLVEKKNAAMLNWSEEDDEVYSKPYADGCHPKLSVVPFGFRTETYSYESLIDDYNERLYNYGYSLLSDITEAPDSEVKAREKTYDLFVNGDKKFYANSSVAISKWMQLPQYFRLSNRSAQSFAINYYKYSLEKSKEENNYDWDYLERLEHERWVRFFISHGWVYALYGKDLPADKNDEQKKRLKAEKAFRRAAKQHDCLCPFDIMLSESTKKYDRGNVKLGFIREIAYSDIKEN